MEPMTLGSPATSPITLGSQPTYPATPTGPFQQNYPGGAGQMSHFGTPTGPGGTPAGAQVAANPAGFLPGYLMGDFSQQSSSRVMSPSKLNRSISVQSQPQSTPHAPSMGAATPSKGYLTPTSNVRTPSEKPVGGPPTTGLFSSVRAASTPKFGTPGTPGAGSHLFNSTPVPSTPQMSFGATPGHNVSVREEVFNTTSHGDSNTWVTVFGFPPSAASFILSQFSQYGTILNHHVPPNGNWMHIKYQTKMQSQKAIGKSNRVLGGSIMIGVCACNDPAVINEDGDGSINNSILSLDRSRINKGHDVSNVTNLNSSLGGARLNSSIRPLAQAYKAATNEHEISMRTNTPNKSSSIVGKAVECIFGW